jgi:hypothetical protein
VRDAIFAAYFAAVVIGVVLNIGSYTINNKVKFVPTEARAAQN